MMEEQQARECIINWAKDYYAGNPTVEVVGIHYDSDWDAWDAQLSVSSSADDPYVTFTEDANRTHGIYVSEIEY